MPRTYHSLTAQVRRYVVVGVSLGLLSRLISGFVERVGIEGFLGSAVEGGGLSSYSMRNCGSTVPSIGQEDMCCRFV